MKKQVVSYKEFVAAQEAKRTPRTVAWVIQRMLDDIAANPEMKQLGQTDLFAYPALQRMPLIATKIAADLKPFDIIEFIKWRRKSVCAATAGQTLSKLYVACKYAASTWEDCAEVTNAVAAIAAAKAYLEKRQLVGKSTPRTRRPTDEEITNLLNYYLEPRRMKRSPVGRRMPDVIAFALVSSRRIGEICRITHGDVDYEKGVYWVRDLKHPTKKKGNDKSFVLWPELASIIRRQPRANLDDPKERIWPLLSTSCSASYTNAKKDLGIEGLHFHDCRGDAISKWLLKMPPEDVRKAVSGHDNNTVLEKVYDRRDPQEIMKVKYAELMKQPASAAEAVH